MSEPGETMEEAIFKLDIELFDLRRAIVQTAPRWARALARRFLKLRKDEV